MLERLDNSTVTLHTGEVLSLHQYTKRCSVYLLKKLASFQDKYSNALRETLINNYDKKWSVVRKALDQLNDSFNLREDKAEYELSMEMAICDIIYPCINEQENEL